MRKSILVASVPHTGTFFTYENIFTRFKPLNIHQMPEPGSKHVRHIGEPDGSVLEKLREQCFTVIPLRAYEKVQETWIRNQMDLGLLAKKWAIMLGMDNVFRLQIDAPDRDEQMRQLSQLIGEPLDTDWMPTNSLNFGSLKRA